MSLSSSSGLSQFLKHIKALYGAALGIENLRIAAAEIGQNTGLYLFGFNLTGIPIAYAMAYALAGLTTFAAILGRYNYTSNSGKVDSCCSVLEQGAGSGFIPNFKTTFKNFVIGITKLPHLHKQPNLKYILKSSAYILVTAERMYFDRRDGRTYILSVFYLTSYSSGTDDGWCFYSSSTRSV